MTLHRRSSHSAAAVVGAVATVLVLTLTLSDSAAGASLAGLDHDQDFGRQDSNHFVGNSDLVVDQSSPGDEDSLRNEEESEGDDFLEPNAVKRKWGQKNMALWGKRGHVTDHVTDDTSDINEVFKRKWGQKNMALWGKRFSLDDVSGDKRKWGQKNMALWGRK